MEAAPLNLRQIEVFRAVMVTGSTTDAARLLHVSQPGISRVIRHLELRLWRRPVRAPQGDVSCHPEAHTLHTEMDRMDCVLQHVQDVADHLQFGNHASPRVLSSANTRH